MPLIRSLFTQSFPYGKYGEDHSLYCVKVASGFCRLALHLVLHQIYIKCMLSIDQWLRTIAPSLGVSVGRLLTYSRFSEVHTPVDFLIVDDLYSMIVMFPPHFSLSAIISKTVIYVVGSCLDPPMAKLRTFSI